MRRVFLAFGVALILLFVNQLPASADPIKGVITPTSFPSVEMKEY